MAGREVARALACMSLKQEDCTSDLAGLTESQLNTLKQWEARFNKQYPIVGHIVEGRPPPPACAAGNLVRSACFGVPSPVMVSGGRLRCHSSMPEFYLSPVVACRRRILGLQRSSSLASINAEATVAFM